MRTQLIFALAVLSGGCALSNASGLPVRAPPFSDDRPIHFPAPSVGQLLVTGFPKNPHSTRPGTTAAWQLYDGAGQPVGEVRRDSADLQLSTGDYVIVTKDTQGHLRTGQFVVRGGEVTSAPLASTTLLNEDALAPEQSD
ncbi:MAG: hypothetical protein JST54_09660 [Deltaproteobacteria bacterium]|nr:hypothetical protein [Deltaproteobacteria bacterium]